MIRMLRFAALWMDSIVSLQSERSQLRTRSRVIRMKNASNPQAFRDLDVHRSVINIDRLTGRNLRGIQRNTKDKTPLISGFLGQETPEALGWECL